jgi:hypothetical protein
VRYARAAESYEFYRQPPTRRTPPSCATCAPTSSTQAGQIRRRRARVPGRRQVAAGEQVPQGRAAAGDGRVREGAQAGQARDHRQRPPVRRGRRPVRGVVPEGQGDRHRHLQERSVLLRLRRLRRGGQTLRPDRRALSGRPERGRRGMSHPAGAEQGEELREHRGLGAAPEEGKRSRRRKSRPAGQADRHR